MIVKTPIDSQRNHIKSPSMKNLIMKITITNNSTMTLTKMMATQGKLSSPTKTQKTMQRITATLNVRQ